MSGRKRVSTASSGDSSTGQGTVTALLVRHGRGDQQAFGQAVVRVYADLKRMARRCLRRERPTPTFDQDCLVHETVVRLVRQDRTRWHDRHHLFAIAARIMRRILVDRARARAYAKRGGGWRVTTLDEHALAAAGRTLDVLALDDALRDLTRYDASLAQLVELRFFAGATNEEIGRVQGVTTMTVIRRWRLARAWLERYLVRTSTP